MAIVIVDDSGTTLIVLKRLSANLNESDALTFCDSKTAAMFLASNDADLIVVDYSMPNMNGIEFIREVRSCPHHRDTPIIMVTQSSDREIRLNALDAGATDFLNKPIDPAEFKARVRNLIRLRNMKRPPQSLSAATDAVGRPTDVEVKTNAPIGFLSDL